MSFSPKAQQVWQLIVPEKAYDHHMLMHGLLTLAANHYVHVKQGTTDPTALHMYRTRALHHQQLGLQLFRHQLQAPSEEASQGILLTFAAMIGMLTFSDASSQQQKLTYEDALGVLSVLRGKQALWRASSGLPETSDVAAAFFDPPPAEYRADLSSTAFALNELHDTTKDVVRRTSISLLKGVIENPFNSEYRLLGTWPAGLSDEFNQLLRNRDGVAMQILGHYCTVVDSMRNLWWIGDIGSMLREAIRAEIEGVSPAQS